MLLLLTLSFRHFYDYGMPAASGRSLQRIDASNIEDLKTAIRQDGAVIIENFTTPELVDQVNEEVRSYLEADLPWRGALFPPETRRCPRLVSRSKVAREQWLVSRVVDELTEFFLAKTTQNYYGAELHTYTTHPIINTSVTIETRPGSAAQRLHRDDKNFHVDHVDQTKTGYRMGSDVEMAFLIPGIETTIENGATQVFDIVSVLG